MNYVLNHLSAILLHSEAYLKHDNQIFQKLSLLVSKLSEKIKARFVSLKTKPFA